ncbi:MAG: DUF1217 domain-containing protein, partial [Sulfitobacter sp.]
MFAPVIPSSGLSGWRFLQRTYDVQFAAFSASARQARATEYFEQNIAKVTSAEELVADRQLLEVALGAFGLEGDIDNRYFIKKVLEEGTINSDSLANRFSNPNYAELSAAFGFGPGEVPRAGLSASTNRVLEKYKASSFEIATGNQDDSMRVALYAQRALSDVAQMEGSNDTKWFTLMGQPPLRALFEKALNLPASFGQIDIDQQLNVFQERAEATFGSSDLSQFSEPENIDAVITKYVVRTQLD